MRKSRDPGAIESVECEPGVQATGEQERCQIRWSWLCAYDPRLDPPGSELDEIHGLPDLRRLIVEIRAPNGGPDARGLTKPESLYERFPWLYAFCRDHLFRDDTKKIATALWPAGITEKGGSVLEFGCGPGFYTRRLAAHSAHLQVTGIDLSSRQLLRARATAYQFANCSFEQGDVRALDRTDASVDAVIASRLFIVLSERQKVLAEMHRVLRPGGRCFVAEPRSALRAAIPLRAMWLLADLSNLVGGQPSLYRERRGIAVMTAGEFNALIKTQKWSLMRCWQDRWYHYAVCEKGSV